MKTLRSYQVSDLLPAQEWVPNHIQIRQYAEALGDFNPIHLDDNYARRVGLGGVIAHGMLTMEKIATLLTEWIGNEGWISKLNVRFVRMVRPDDTIRFTGFIRARSEKTLICHLEAINQKDERVLSGLTQVNLNSKETYR